jgi:hypothetical protein
MTDEKDTQSSSYCIFCLRLFLWHGMSSSMFCLIKLRICYIYITVKYTLRLNLTTRAHTKFYFQLNESSLQLHAEVICLTNYLNSSFRRHSIYQVVSTSVMLACLP